MVKLFKINIVDTLKDKSKIKELLNTLTECFFLFVIFCLSYRIQVGLTTFYIDPNYTFWNRLYKLTLLAAGFKAVMNYKNKTLWLSIPVAAVFYLAFPREHYLWEPFYAPLIIGCVGVKVRKIFYAAFIPATVVIIVMMMASLSGAINSMATFDRNIRSYWGHISPTDFGTAVLMIVCFIWIIFKDLPEEFFIIPAAFSLFISFYVTRSSTSGYLTVLLILMFICRAFGRSVIEKTGRFKWMQKLMDIAMVLVFPVLGLITIAMVYAYYKEMPFAATLNVIFHQRLLPAANMLAKYGIKPFGTYFNMIGYGGSTISGINEYTFIDSTYPQILIRYGFITYIVANIMWIYTTYKALKIGNRRVAYVMALLAMDFVMEHHWYELSYNVFIVIPFADFIASTEEKESTIERAITDFKERWKNKRYAFTFTVMSLCQLLVIFLLMPTAFSWLRTIINGYGIYGGGKKVFAAVTLIFITAVAFIWNLSSIVAGVISEKKIRKINAVTFACAFVIGLVSFMLGNVMINRVTSENKARIEEERDLLEPIISEASDNVYADKLPEAYIRSINGISRSYFCGEDFARYDNATVIADASWDSQCLTGRGFLYLQISDEDAIFTNDDSVINVLKEKGYKLKGYNSYEHKVDLIALAGMNDLNIMDDGSIRLEGTEHQLVHGPYIDLNYGLVTTKFEMMLSNDDFSQDDKICSIKIVSDSGRQIKNTVDLYRRDFDAEGNVDYEVKFEGYGSKNEFLVFTEEDVDLEIGSISYRRTPNYDSHVKVDDKGRITRIECYDLDGNPYDVSGGYYGYENVYDDNDNVIIQRFLGSDFEPSLIGDGYAEIHREYNLKKEVTRESFYGVNGEPLAPARGYQAVEREYDFKGNLISESYYDTNHNPVMMNAEYFMYKTTFNDDNRWVKIEYFDTDRNAVCLKAGYAAVEREYDEAGNVIEERFYGTDGEPALYYESYHKYKMEYDEKNQIIRVIYYGINDEPIIQSGNYAGYEREYDEAGNVIKHTYIGVDGEPIRTDWLYATWRRAYNSKKQVIREEYYDVNDNGIALELGQFAVEYEYDEAGNSISDAYYGINDEKILITSGYWKVVRTYNEKHQVVHEEYLGTDGSRILISDKYSMVDFSYDENDKLIKYTYKDMDGNVVEEQVVE